MSKKYLTIAFSGMFVFSGCQSFTSKQTESGKAAKKSSWFGFGKKEYQIPQSMAVIWKEDTIFVPGKAPTRGFGGRLYFYNEKSQAIPVDGELTVYGYDESNPNPGKANPNEADKKFKFTAEQFTKHFSESQLGASYSIWIPWDEVGGPNKKISLIPTFLTADGKLVRGEPSKQVLPGPAGPEELPLNNSPIRQVSYNEVTGAQSISTNVDPNTAMRTTTIGLPSQMAQRLTQPSNNQSPPTNFQNLQLPPNAQAAQIYEMLQQMNQPTNQPLAPAHANETSYGTNNRAEAAAEISAQAMQPSAFITAPPWPKAPLGR